MRKTQRSLLICTLITLPVAALAADGSRPNTAPGLKREARSVGMMLREDSKRVGFAVRHAGVQVGHAARDFWTRVAAATRQAAHEMHARGRD
jgi:hypothetical protein